MESQQVAEAPMKTQRRSYRRRHIELTETDPAKKKIEYRVKYNAMRKAEEGEADILTIEVDDLARAVADRNSCATYQEPDIDPRSPLLSNWHIPQRNSCATYQEPTSTLDLPLLSNWHTHSPAQLVCHLPEPDIDPRSPLLSNWHTHSPAQLVCHLPRTIDRAPKYPSELAHLIENGAFRDAQA
ncbi:hypothetical protein PAPYR_12510 [Paratrimastix pyriformis]|uniref:Uncharacterized protein n=1 Tax=Paratrimastix pyriformis TaxID=342808 RepID=A0ABQ8U8F5_9EUKA|nr:hypothetical protein PAPYR_12510 [Paratrimastix pyriformis]